MKNNEKRACSCERQQTRVKNQTNNKFKRFYEHAHNFMPILHDIQMNLFLNFQFKNQ